METKFIEATNYPKTGINWGKFMLGRFTREEWNSPEHGTNHSLLEGQGWTHSHLLVLDLATGEGAVFYPKATASVSYDLNEKHKIWVCPLFEPFLRWLYKQDVSDLTKLPGYVTLTDGGDYAGYRREGHLAGKGPGV